MSIFLGVFFAFCSLTMLMAAAANFADAVYAETRANRTDWFYDAAIAVTCATICGLAALFVFN